MKTIRKILVAICVLAMVFSTLSTPVYAASSQSFPNTSVQNNGAQLTTFLDWFGGWFGYAKNPSLNKTSLSLEKGGTYTLRTSNVKGSVSWTSSATDVVTVSKSGYVKAINPGDATVTAKSGDVSLTCEVHVYGAEFTPENIELAVGEKVTLRATLNGRAMSLSRISSADSRIAKVTNRGVITAVGAGTTTIVVNVHGVRYNVPVNVKSPTEITVTDLNEDEFTTARARIEAYLYAQNLQLAEVLRAVNVSVKNATGNVEVVVDNVDVEDLSNVHLYHIDNDVDVEELDFTVQNGKLAFVSDSFSPFVLVTIKDAETNVEQTNDGYVVINPVNRVSDCNIAFMEKSWFEEPDAFIKGFGSTLQGYMLTYRDADGNVIVPDEPQTVVIENVDFSQFNTDDEIVLAYTYIDPNVYNGNNNGVMYMDSVPYEYDAENHRVTFTFDAFQPYYGNIEICQGGHRDLIVDEPHDDLTWSVDNNCEWGDVLVDQNGRVEVWGSFDNIEVTATDGNKTWVWLINVSSNDIINKNIVVNVGETFYCYGYDDMRAGSYVSSEIRDDGHIDYSHECGAIRDNGDGTATALKPGTYNLAIGFKYFLGQEGYSIQFGSITIIGDEQIAPSITPLDETALNNALDRLNAHLSAENKVVDQVALAVDVVPNGNTSIDIENVEALDDAVLYHIGDDGTITTVPYTLVDGTLHFENDEFSPYLLVTTKDLPMVTIDPAFLGVWQAQGTNILWVVDIHDDGTFDSYYPNYPQGNTSATYSISEDGKTIELFEQYFSFDEYGNLTDAEWNAGEHHAQRIMTRFENIMGWWRTDDSFVEGEIYPAEGKGFYLQEEEYGKTYSLDSEGHLTFFNNNEDTFYYDVDNDCIIAQHTDGTQSILHRWIDTYVR